MNDYPNNPIRTFFNWFAINLPFKKKHFIIASKLNAVPKLGDKVLFTLPSYMDDYVDFFITRVEGKYILGYYFENQIYRGKIIFKDKVFVKLNKSVFEKQLQKD